MRKFIRNTILFLTAYLIISYTLYYTDLYIMLLPNNRLYKIISRSKEKKTRTRTLILGDSVTMQLLDELNNNDTITSLACNQAIDMIGHYLLFREFIGKNDSVKKVYLFYNPFSFSNDLDHKYTYNYFLKTFYKPKYKSEITDYARKQIKKIPYSEIAGFPPVAITFWSPMYEPDKNNKIFLSEISKEYLQMIIKTAHSRNMEIVIESPPVKESRKKEVEKLYTIYKNSADTSDMFNYYFRNIVYLPDSMYMDHLHFKNMYIPEVRKLVAEKL